MDKTPQRMGYLKHDEWADRVSQQFKEAEERAIASNNPASAVYFLLKRWEHERQVEKEKKSYNGL